MHIHSTKTRKGSTQWHAANSVYLKYPFLSYIPGIYPVYSIYQLWFSSWTLSGPLRLSASLASLRPGLLADPLGFGHRQATNVRLGSAECPQPRVDFVNVAYFTRGLAWTICASALKGGPLSAGVLVWNSRGGIAITAIQEARNERHPSKKVGNPANVDSGNRGGLMEFPHCICLHVPVICSCRSSKALKKT